MKANEITERIVVVTDRKETSIREVRRKVVGHFPWRTHSQIAGTHQHFRCCQFIRERPHLEIRIISQRIPRSGLARSPLSERGEPRSSVCVIIAPEMNGVSDLAQVPEATHLLGSRSRIGKQRESGGCQ